MAPGRKRLRKLQLGGEVTPGTSVAATTLWRGKGSMLEDQREVVVVGDDEQIGILGGSDRSYIPKLFGTLELSQTEATFEQLQYLFAMGLGGPTTGAADGLGTDKIYTTTVPTTSVPTGKFYTVQGGDDFEVEQLEYSYASKIEISGSAGEGLFVSASLAGRQVQRIASFTGAIAVPSVTDIVFSGSKLYIDAVGGTYGTTQVSNQFLGMKLTISPKWVPNYTGDGQLYFSAALYVDQMIDGEITFEHDSAVSGLAGEKANWRAQTPRLLQIKFEGATVTTPGTTYSKKTFIINLPIKWRKFNAISDKDGNDIVVASFFSKYNSTAGNAGSFIVVNELTALP